MALITNNKLKNQIIKKYHKKLLKFYFKEHKHKLRKYKYKEVLYTLPYLGFVIHYVYHTDQASTVNAFNNTLITKKFYDFYFADNTQKALIDIASSEFEFKDYQNRLYKLFFEFSDKLADVFWDELQHLAKVEKKPNLTQLIYLLMCYFYTDDIIDDFGPDINKLMSDKKKYNRNVDLFQLKL